jgi:hypothetical protein
MGKQLKLGASDVGCIQKKFWKISDIPVSKGIFYMILRAKGIELTMFQKILGSIA